MNNNDKIKELKKLFGSFRAEWLKDEIYNLFAEPHYFSELIGIKPCILQGGRGTGKTTLLKRLSYQGQYSYYFKENNIDAFFNIEYIGIYHKVNTNHVRAFLGEELTENQWQRVFSHYINIVVSREILYFVKWYSEKYQKAEELNASVCNLFAKSIGIDAECNDINTLIESIELSMYDFQSSINSIHDNYKKLKLTLAGDPIILITEKVLSLEQFRGKIFYIIFDEYENFTDYQQKIINTLIKHSTESYTFKIGVRELGWKVKHTLNNEELLIYPSDYALIDIENKLTENNSDFFSDFAKEVCQQRIQKLFDEENSNDFSIVRALGDLPIEEEAILLEIKKHPYYIEFINLPQDILSQIGNISPLFSFFIVLWSKIHNESINDNIENFITNPQKWRTRYDNYSYDTLFKIRKGKVGIQKYYSGWNTYVKLANGNIRYLMQLIYTAYEKHLNSSENISSVVSSKNQTLAAQEVGQKNLKELEGLWKDGSKLTKLLLCFGRIFNVLASEEIKTAPEQNQFAFDKEVSPETQELLDAAVMYLALVRMPGNKLNSLSESKEYMYTLHPIFSPYFGFSYRRKRKITINDEDFQGIILDHKKFIKNILGRNQVNFSETMLPSQLNLFESFYND